MITAGVIRRWYDIDKTWMMSELYEWCLNSAE
jgi:hypothetical protein